MIVYQHIRLDNDQPFYIGIGSNKKRAFRTSGRNDIWNKITNKTKYRVEIIFEGLSKEEACKKEIELIGKYGRINDKTGILSNITMGGEILLGEESPRFNRGKKIEIDGVEYDSISGAARKLKMLPETITYRLKKESFPNYRKLYGDTPDVKYTNEEIQIITHNRNRGQNNGMFGKTRTIIEKLLWNVNKKNRYEIIVNGVQYMSISHAAFITKIHYKKLYRSIKNKTQYVEFTTQITNNKIYTKELIQKYINTTNMGDLTLYPQPEIIQMLKSF